MEEAIDGIVDVGDGDGVGVCTPSRYVSKHVLIINLVAASVTIRWYTESM